MRFRLGVKALIEVLNLINGEFVATEECVENLNPATSKQTSVIPRSTTSDVDAAVIAAKRAFPAWAVLSYEERADWLDKIADALEAKSEEIATLESMDTGKPISLARAVDAARSITNFRFFAKQVRELEVERFEMEDASNHVIMQPVGVAGLITPWNLPLYLLSWKIAPAIAMGNTVVAKPSELTPLTADLLARVLVDVGLPAGVVNIVHGYGHEAGQALTEHPDTRIISFTGGTATGKIVASTAAPMFKKLSLELGGKNSTIVFADADMEKTVSGVSRAGLLNQGQVCLCGSRILVESSIYDQFLADLCEHIEAMKLGDPSDEDTELGSLVSKEHRSKVESFIQIAKDEGGVICTGGKRPDFEEGAFLEPTVISGLSIDSTCSTEEIFGPIVVVHPFDTEEEAVAIANGVEYGLAASVWTSDLEKGRRVSEALDTGMVWVNTWLHRDLRTPFGGTKASGVGREGGRWSLSFYSEAQNICIKR
ncbi:aldehyde dehydrogenase [Deltaproteobacteria bacterium]|nr:aldehyde dehydrogenase [Deltaproteobacteria bacterium]